MPTWARRFKEGPPGWTQNPTTGQWSQSQIDPMAVQNFLQMAEQAQPGATRWIQNAIMGDPTFSIQQAAQRFGHIPGFSQALASLSRSPGPIGMERPVPRGWTPIQPTAPGYRPVQYNQAPSNMQRPEPNVNIFAPQQQQRPQPQRQQWGFPAGGAPQQSRPTNPSMSPTTGGGALLGPIRPEELTYGGNGAAKPAFQSPGSRSFSQMREFV